MHRIREIFKYEEFHNLSPHFLLNQSLMNIFEGQCQPFLKTRIRQY